MSRANRPRHQASSDFSIARILSDRSIGHKSSRSASLPADDPLKNEAAGSRLDPSENRLSDGLSASDADHGVELSRRFRDDSVVLREKTLDTVVLREKSLDTGPEDIGARDSVGDSSAGTGSADSRDLTWLQYTRYRPPRLPRRSSLTGKQPKRRPGLHPRIPFSHGQLQTLEDRYRRSAYLSRRDVMEISASLHLPQSRVKIWFQNRRARDRRESHRSS